MHNDDAFATMLLMSQISAEKDELVRPLTTASSHSPVPPTRMGSLPRARISLMMGMAASAYRATDHCSDGSATAIMWWGTPSISCSVGAAVPIVMPR